MKWETRNLTKQQKGKTVKVMTRKKRRLKYRRTKNTNVRIG